MMDCGGERVEVSAAGSGQQLGGLGVGPEQPLGGGACDAGPARRTGGSSCVEVRAVDPGVPQQRCRTGNSWATVIVVNVTFYSLVTCSEQRKH